MMVMMMVVMGPGSERGSCEYHQKQYSGKQFLHKSNPNTRRFAGGGARPHHVSQK
jgi:hypothetical protein